MLTLSVGVTGDDAELQREVDRLQSVIKLAGEEALLQGREIGMKFYPDGYEFAAYYEDFVEYRDLDDPDDVDQSEWAVFAGQPVLSRHRLPQGILLELEIEGRAVILDPEDEPMAADSEDIDRAYQPQIRIFSSGDVSPFIVQLRRAFQNRSSIIEVKIDGTVEIIRDGPEI